MTRITREQFQRKFATGIDVEDRTLRREARRVGVSRAQLRGLDEDGDGLIAGEELERAYDLLDRLDSDDDIDRWVMGPGLESVPVQIGATSWPTPPGEDPLIDRGGDTRLYHAFVAAIHNPRARIVEVARAFHEDPRLRHGYRGREQMLSQSRMHNGRRRPDGLIATNFENTYKCNLFIGDVLARAGFRTPTLHAADGSWEHYRYAEDWPKSSVFERLSDVRSLEPGDVVVLDTPHRGSGGGHLEIVTHVSRDARGEVIELESIGARWADNAIVEDGARIAPLLRAQRVEGEDGVYFEAQDVELKIFLLRPKGLKSADLAQTHLRP